MLEVARAGIRRSRAPDRQCFHAPAGAGLAAVLVTWDASARIDAGDCNARAGPVVASCCLRAQAIISIGGLGAVLSRVHAASQDCRRARYR